MEAFMRKTIILVVGLIFLLQGVGFSQGSGLGIERLEEKHGRMPSYRSNFQRPEIATTQEQTQLTGVIIVNRSPQRGNFSGPPIYLKTADGKIYQFKNPTGYYTDSLWQKLLALEGQEVTITADITDIPEYSGYDGYLENVSIVETSIDYNGIIIELKDGKLEITNYVDHFTFELDLETGKIHWSGWTPSGWGGAGDVSPGDRGYTTAIKDMLLVAVKTLSQGWGSFSGEDKNKLVRVCSYLVATYVKSLSKGILLNRRS
jgi:hypothetical protein